MYTVYRTTRNKDRLSVLRILQNSQELELILNGFAAEFYQFFYSETGYQHLDERKRLTAAKISELLLVLEHPEFSLSNNPADLGARKMLQRGNISHATQTS